MLLRAVGTHRSPCITPSITPAATESLRNLLYSSDTAGEDTGDTGQQRVDGLLDWLETMQPQPLRLAARRIASRGG